MHIPVDAFTLTEPVELAEDWRLCRIGPLGPDNALGFQLIMPRSWQPSPLEMFDMNALGPNQLTPLAHFKPGGSTHDLPFLEVGITRFPWDVPLRDFFELATSIYELKPQILRQATIHDLKVWDGVFQTEGPKANGARVMVFKSAGFLWRIWGVGPLKAFEEELAGGFELVLESYTRNQPSDDAHLYPPQTVNTSFGLRFQAPAGWTVKELPPRSNMEVLDLHLPALDRKELLAYQRSKLLKGAKLFGTSGQEAASRALEEWRESGFQAGELEDLGQSEIPMNRQLFMTQGRMNRQDISFWVSVIPTATGTLVHSSLAPAKTTNPIAWMAARRAHMLALETLEWM